MNSSEPGDLKFEDILVGQEYGHEYVISPDVYQHFLSAFGDISPLHMDDAFAQAHGFSGKVMHGNILNGFVSHFVGMQCPGRRAILHSVAMEYKAPSYLGDRIRLEAVVTQKVDSLRVMILAVALRNLSQDKIVAKAKVQVGFLQ